ncbi:hypothetical protein AMTR_s00077p00120140 [Amborella trichopoda]|uniref:F-box domain-containing protein n=1 Tax=Amborella trichopoda TaxID=13333 RepID=W1PB27_AMBTC|nr:hypothetical protein AMTR_s00077p00120140 [Amborella trichopoda]
MLQKPVTSRKRNQLHEASSSTVEANTSRFQEISSIENNEVEDRTVVSLPQLPNDIIDRIIVKLPLEPICRFKSVCKSWEHHLSSRNFGAMRARSMHMPAQTFGVISVLSRFYFLRSLSQPNANVSLSKLKLNAGDVMTKDMYASNGMICFDDSNGIFICNPVEKELIAIPRILKWGLEIRGFYFDPFKHPILERNYRGLSSVRVPPKVGVHGLHVLHNVEVLCVTFNMETEEWARIPFPSNFTGEVCSFVEWDGRLCLVHAPKRFELVIWRVTEMMLEKVMPLCLDKRYYSRRIRPHIDDLVMIGHVRFLFIARALTKSIEITAYDIEGNKTAINWKFCLDTKLGCGSLSRIFPFTPTLLHCVTVLA